ncbi:MAG TPA: hypothetical protein VFE61_16480 [Candidatus Sulfotelmatobacter sp.]|jgi:hypothetical protein|nr:hypothetical protein [Candidatus Sulfotelmatobacter sp.]
MKRWLTAMLSVCLIFLAAVPAYCQRGTVGVDFGQTSDKFGGLTANGGFEGILEGEGIVLKSSDRDHGADVIAGGEVRFPSDTASHAKEFAVFGGVAFHFGKGFSAGFHGQVRRIYLPPTVEGTQTFYRARLSVLELPGFLEYKFGPNRHAFLRADGGAEFNPHFHYSVGNGLPNPNLDHGYMMRGTLGYVFGKWYAKGFYETRYFKFRNNLGNPSGLYNWRDDVVAGGVGLVF